ncbi:MAG: SxtJ family membrane protein, partial [Burkholderiales bacterium]
WWALAAAAALLALALAAPRLLARPNRLWMRLGLLLGNLVSPVALALLYYGVLAPLGVAMRLSGKDALRLKLDRGADSYWLERKPPGPPPDSLNNQF